MSNIRAHLSLSLVSICIGAVSILLIAYIGLIAVVMSYATLTIEFTQSVRNDETEIAALESEYLSGVAKITKMDYSAAGYATPVATRFVPTRSVTALR